MASSSAEAASSFCSCSDLRALEVAARERHVGALGLDGVLLQLRFGAGERRALGQEVGVELADARPELFLVELRQHGSGRHDLVDIHVQLLDDAVRLRLHLDFGDRFHLPCRHDRPDHGAALDGGELGRVDINRCALEGGVAPDARNQEDEDGLRRESKVLRFFMSSSSWAADPRLAGATG